LPTCSAALTSARGNWLNTLTRPESRGKRVNAPMKR
jgi:hypothetical protein